MKITTDGMAVGNLTQSTRQREKTSQQFDQILTDIENREPTSVEKAKSSQPAFEITPVLFDSVNSNEGLLQTLDGSLALLESYQTRLSDSAIPVHELELDINRLEEQTSQLQSELDNLTGDSPVKDLLNRSVVAMTVEIEKYRRGDFT